MMSSHTARAVEQLYFTAEALTAADDNSGRGIAAGGLGREGRQTLRRRREGQQPEGGRFRRLGASRRRRRS